MLDTIRTERTGIRPIRINSIKCCSFWTFSKNPKKPLELVKPFANENAFGSITSETNVFRAMASFFHGRPRRVGWAWSIADIMSVNEIFLTGNFGSLISQTAARTNKRRSEIASLDKGFLSTVTNTSPDLMMIFYILRDKFKSNQSSESFASDIYAFHNYDSLERHYIKPEGRM